MTDRELMQQALDALEYASDETKPEGLHGCDCLICEAIPALRDRLAQPEQEPVAWYDKHGMVTHDPFEGIRPLYAAPRQWVGLTDEEVHDCFQQGHKNKAIERQLISKAIEAKLKEKNT
jgi:hypothetical protein